MIQPRKKKSRNKSTSKKTHREAPPTPAEDETAVPKTLNTKPGIHIHILFLFTTSRSVRRHGFLCENQAHALFTDGWRWRDTTMLNNHGSWPASNPLHFFFSFLLLPLLTVVTFVSCSFPELNILVDWNLWNDSLNRLTAWRTPHDSTSHHGYLTMTFLFSGLIFSSSCNVVACLSD